MKVVAADGNGSWVITETWVINLNNSVLARVTEHCWDIDESRAYAGEEISEKYKYYGGYVEECSVLLEEDEKFGINILKLDKIKSIKQPSF